MEQLNLGTNELLLVGIVVFVGLSVILQCISLIKITQIQNGLKHRVHNNQISANDGKKHGNQNQNPNKNKKQQDNRANQNNRPAQPQINQNKPQQPNAPEKKFEKIVSNAMPLKETNAQLANRPKTLQIKTKVYSERSATTVQKQERPANAPIKQQDLPKVEIEQTPQAVAPQPQNREAAKPVEVKNEDMSSVQYGRR
ncbi:MAG: hypothetical protein FWF51_09505 [Chitinivibrionia bacterium]|jgi:hypothetical protein|nr:hypothetical protein [Chitinivibrionia bacterium]